MNERKDKILYQFWLTEQEEKLFLESIESIPSLAWALIKKAYKRGDFEKL